MFALVLNFIWIWIWYGYGYEYGYEYEYEYEYKCRREERCRQTVLKTRNIIAEDTYEVTDCHVATNTTR